MTDDKRKDVYENRSPMVTHCHRTSHFNVSPEKVTRNRSKSFGFEGDMLLPPIVPFVSQESRQPETEHHSNYTTPTERQPSEGEKTISNPFYISVLYGIINAFIVLPVLMSFGSIIYRDEHFAPYMPVLVKLTVVSGLVHQLCFSTLSGLPFAVGQVQDAGLIFLSSIAGNLVQYCQLNHLDDEVMLATVTVGLSLATAILGMGLVIIGNLRLAQYVQMLPTPVIGGYLAYIGFFCGVSGLALMASGGGSALSVNVLIEKKFFVLPGLIGGILIYILVRTSRHMMVLPLCITSILLAFYLALYFTNTSISEVTVDGWIRQSNPPPPWYDTWDFLKLDKVAWHALPSQTITVLSMTFVVALSSSLDVAAIELEMGQPLNYNSELIMVGISNLASGITGGYTGSYIFSQSIFSLRAGIKSRLAGFCLAACEFFVLMSPIPILSYLPNFFFGSLLVMICVDLMVEWLWEVRLKLSLVEYSICLSTFFLIQVTGVEYGIILGVLIHMLCNKVGINLASSSSDDEVMHVTNPTESISGTYGTDSK
jgi:sulfate permease, SulP family